MPGQDLTDGVRAHPNRPLPPQRSWRVEDLAVGLMTLGVGVLSSPVVRSLMGLSDSPR